MRSLAFIGCAHIHTPGFVDAVLKRGIPVRGVWDQDPDRAQRTAEKLGAEIHQLDAVLTDPAVDAVVITSETNHHLDLVKHVVAAGKPMFVEKPIGCSGHDAWAIARLVEDAGLPFHTGYRMRGSGPSQQIKRWIGEGKFGTITRARASICHSGALGGWFDGEWRWMADLSQAGVGAFGDLGTHGLDLLMWLLGDVELATGTLSMGTARYAGCDELGEGQLRFKSGAIGTLAASWDDVANPISLQIAGTAGHAWVLNDQLFAVIDGISDGSSPLLDLPSVSGGFDGFLDWCEGKPAEFVSASEAASRDAVMEAMYRGAKHARWEAPVMG